jgi:hypothetical protein
MMNGHYVPRKDTQGSLRDTGTCERATPRTPRQSTRTSGGSRRSTPRRRLSVWQCSAGWRRTGRSGTARASARRR